MQNEMFNPDRTPASMAGRETTFPAVCPGRIGDASVQTVNARDLHTFLEVGKRFSTWIQDRIGQYGFIENQDYVVIREVPKNSSGDRPTKVSPETGKNSSGDRPTNFASQNGEAIRGGHNRADYHISIDMAKELSMVERNAKGKQARQYFIRMEQMARTAPSVDFSDPAVLVPLLTSYAQRTQIAEGKVAALEPRACAWDRLDASEGAVNVRVAAKMLNVSERKFIAWLQANRWAFRQNGIGPLQAYVEKRNCGYLEHRPHTFHDRGRGEDRTVAQLMITPSGLARLARIFTGQGLPGTSGKEPGAHQSDLFRRIN